MNAVAKDSPNPWNALASQNPVVHFIDVCLRGAGQVMFQNNPLTGLFFLVGIFWGAYSAHMISVGIGAVLGTIMGTLTAYALRAPRENINMGLHGYNGILVGCALPTFFAATPLLWGYIVAGSIFSTVLMMAVEPPPRMRAVQMAMMEPTKANTAAQMELTARPMRNRMPVITLLIRNTCDTPANAALQNCSMFRANRSDAAGCTEMAGCGRLMI